jgi:hypothetical protein
MYIYTDLCINQIYKLMTVTVLECWILVYDFFFFIRDEETQLIVLKIVKSIQTKLQASEVSELLPLISGFCISPSIPCRNVMYDILMWVYDNYR